MMTAVKSNHKNFRFIVSPSPGSRSLDIMSYQHLHEIEHTTFVTEDHVLVKFNSGKIVTFKSDGTIADDMPEDMGKNPKIIAESALNKGLKFVAIEANLDDLMLLKFIEIDGGNFQCVAKLDNYLDEMCQLIGGNIHGEDDIFVKDTLLTDSGELIKIAVRVNEGVQHISI